MERDTLGNANTLGHSAKSFKMMDLKDFQLGVQKLINALLTFTGIQKISYSGHSS